MQLNLYQEKSGKKGKEHGKQSNPQHEMLIIRLSDISQKKGGIH